MTYGMLIDTRYCSGCQTCVVSCKMSNQVSDDAFYSHVISLDGDVLYQATGTFPNVTMKFRPTLCNHCESPVCFANCPTGAIAKDAKTGIVAIDKDLCIGCGDCAVTCPYEIPVVVKDEGIAGKCDFCSTRVADGELPYCVAACPTRTRYFGDIDDPDSEISKMITEFEAEVYMLEAGTNPSVFYVV